MAKRMGILQLQLQLKLKLKHTDNGPGAAAVGAGDRVARLNAKELRQQEEHGHHLEENEDDEDERHGPHEPLGPPYGHVAEKDPLQPPPQGPERRPFVGLLPNAVQLVIVALYDD